MRKKQQFIQLLQEAFEVPEPQRKQSFLRSLGKRRIRCSRFLLQQAAYIRKRTWGLSLAVFMAALTGARWMEGDILWLLSAMMPILALSAVAEYARSEVYGMAELEMASRFGLKSAILARMAVLGMLHAAILCLAALFVHGEGASVFRAGIYLLVPYLLTDTAALWLCRRIRGREVIYAGAGVAVMVGFLPLLARYTGGWLQQDSTFRGWAVSAVLLCFTAVSEWKKSIRRTEELAWN